MKKNLSIREIISLNKKKYGIVANEAEEDWTQANKFDLNQVDKEVDKSMKDQENSEDSSNKGGKPDEKEEEKEEKKDFLTSENAVVEMRKILKTEIEKSFKCVLANPDAEAVINDEGIYTDSFRVGAYNKPNGFFESSEKTVFETSVEWDEEKQETELTSLITCIFTINKNEYSIPLKEVNFSIASKT